MERAEADDLLRNPAALYAALHWAADTDLGARIHVLMPYTDRLREFAEWFRQLWAESLGKRVDREGRAVHVGPTPVAAVGATDQHSQVQLFMEGPFDKVITFVRLERFGDGSADPAAGRGPSGRTSPTCRATPWASCSRRVRGDLGGPGADGTDELHPAAARSHRRTAWARPSCSFSWPPGTPGSGTASTRSTSPGWSWVSDSPTRRWAGRLRVRRPARRRLADEA